MGCKTKLVIAIEILSKQLLNLYLQLTLTPNLKAHFNFYVPISILKRENKKNRKKKNIKKIYASYMCACILTK